MISVEQAAERLRRIRSESIQDVYGMPDDDDGLRADRMLVIDEHLRETDPRLVDEAFAKSLGVEYCQSKYRLTEDGKSYLYSFGNGAMSLHIDDGCHIADPTIGDFYTACRLFGVTVTPTGAKEQ